jgi:hypothetical protein
MRPRRREQVDDLGGGFDEHRLDVGVDVRDPVPDANDPATGASTSQQATSVASGTSWRAPTWISATRPQPTRATRKRSGWGRSVLGSFVKSRRRNRRSREEDIKIAARRIDRRPFPEVGFIMIA